MKVLSLFDGISCGMIALERAGIDVNTYYASEIDKHAEGVSAYNFPNIIRLGDVNNYELWTLPHIDLLIGGSPCQDLSIAKANREGLSGKRLYWTNIPCVEQLKDKGILLSDIIESGTVDRDKSLCLTRRYAGFNGGQDYFRHRYFGKSFGQAVFEGNATPEEHKRAYKEFGRYSGVEIDGTMRQMTHNECERLQTLPFDYTKYERIGGEVKETPKNARYEMIGNGWTVDVIAHIFTHIPKEGEAHG